MIIHTPKRMNLLRQQVFSNYSVIYGVTERTPQCVNEKSFRQSPLVNR